jgi:oligo-1,6-glucosidase
MIQLRKSNLTLVYGKFELIDENNKQIFSYTRQLDNQKLLVVLNFSDREARLKSDVDISGAHVLISNYVKPLGIDLYRPYEAVIYKIIKNQ